MFIANFFDRATSFLMDPLNSKFTFSTQFLAGLSTLGFAHAASTLW